MIQEINQLREKKTFSLLYICNWVIILILCFTIQKKQLYAKSSRIYSAIVVEAKSKKILYSYNASRYVYPASLTKMMTLYLLYEALKNKKINFRTRFKVSKRASRQPSTKLFLRRGSTISVRDAMLGLITKSANDVATVVGEALGKSEKNFALLMTRKARKLGMKNTTFKNASGLPNSRQRTTAKDMVILSRALYHNFPQYYKYFKTITFLYKGRRYKNHNKLIGKVFGLDGIKTGYTRASGHNIATSVQRNGKRIIAIVFGGKTSRWRDKRVTELINKGFSKLKTHRIIPLRIIKRSIPINKPKIIPITPSQRKKNKPLKNYQKKELKKDSLLKRNSLIITRPYKNAQEAHKLMLNIINELNVKKYATISIRLINNKNSYYEGKIIGLTNNDAVKACNLIKRKGYKCVINKIINVVNMISN